MNNSQPKTWSAIESVMNIVIGFGVALLSQILVFPFFGIHISLGENFLISCIFTVISFVRSYSLRRAFNWLHATGLYRKISFSQLTEESL